MARTPEEPIPIESTYRDLLRAAVERAGGQYAVAALARVNQSTISRAIEGRATYATLRKLSAVLPGIPAPIIAVRDEAHERWCRLGAELAAAKPAVFSVMLQAVSEALCVKAEPPSDAALDQLRRVVADPLPSRRRRS